MIGDDRERLDGGARQAPLDRGFELEALRQVGRGAEGPTARDLCEHHAAIAVVVLELREQSRDVAALRQAIRDLHLGDGHG